MAISAFNKGGQQNSISMPLLRSQVPDYNVLSKVTKGLEFLNVRLGDGFIFYSSRLAFIDIWLNREPSIVIC